MIVYKTETKYFEILLKNKDFERFLLLKVQLIIIFESVKENL